MGDELALRNDYDFVESEEHADDNRWVHRPAMPWDVAGPPARSTAPSSTAFGIGLRHVITVRAALPSLDASVESEILDPVNPAVLVLLRRFPSQTMVGVYNVTPESAVAAAVGHPAGQLGLGCADRRNPAD